MEGETRTKRGLGSSRTSTFVSPTTENNYPGHSIGHRTKSLGK
jgi:hypothetical protein